MPPSTDDLRIARLEMLSPPSQVIGEAPSSFMIDEMVEAARAAVHNILHGEDDRLVITSRYFLELSGEETAAALGIPEGTVKSRLSRALARLRAKLEEATRG